MKEEMKEEITKEEAKIFSSPSPSSSPFSFNSPSPPSPIQKYTSLLIKEGLQKLYKLMEKENDGHVLSIITDILYKYFDNCSHSQLNDVFKYIPLTNIRVQMLIDQVNKKYSILFDHDTQPMLGGIDLINL